MTDPAPNLRKKPRRLPLELTVTSNLKERGPLQPWEYELLLPVVQQFIGELVAEHEKAARSVPAQPEPCSPASGRSTELAMPPSQIVPPDRTTPMEFAGAWRINSMEVWPKKYLDLVVPAHITFDDESMGEFQFGTVRGWLDCRWTERDGEAAVEFSWEGENDNDPGCGRGWATLDADGKLRGRLFIHRGDDSEFVAEKAATRVPKTLSRQKRG